MSPRLACHHDQYSSMLTASPCTRNELRPRLPRARERAAARPGGVARRTAAPRHLYPAGSRVLEAGCGVGAQTVTLVANSPEARFTSSTSPTESLAAAASQGRRPREFLQADIFDLPFEPDSFDHVFVCFVLEHLSRPVAALRRLQGVLQARRDDHGDRGRSRLGVLPSRQRRRARGDPVPGDAARRRRRLGDRPPPVSGAARGRVRGRARCRRGWSTSTTAARGSSTASRARRSRR